MIVLAQAVWRDVTAANAIAVQQAVMGAGEPVFHMVNSGDALIARSRSILATRFLQEEQVAGADVLVMVDGDITFEPSDLQKIANGARETGDIYGGIYVTRAREPHAASRTLTDQRWEFKRTPERRPLEVQYLATGFMAIPRSLLEEMSTYGGNGSREHFEDIDDGHILHSFERGANAEHVIDFFRTFGIVEPDGVTHWLSEDWAFCERARQMGHKVWADQSVILGHQGAVTLTVEDLGGSGHAFGPDSVPAERTMGALYTDDPLALDPLVESLVEDIAEFRGSTPELVSEFLPRATAELAEEWRQQLPSPGAEFVPEDGDGLQSALAWYQRKTVGYAYIYDLANWHIQGRVPEIYHRQIAEAYSGHGTYDAREMRVLDYGAGIGTLALMLARDGHHVIATDANDYLRKFHHWRANRHGLTLHPLPTKRGDLSLIDLVIATHVFEHIETADLLRATLRELAGMMKRDGRLFYENDWVADDLHPQHFDHSAIFEAALVDAGFQPAPDLGDHWRRYSPPLEYDRVRVPTTESIQEPERELAVGGGSR